MYGSSLWGSEHADKGHSQQITNLGWCRLPRYPIANLCDADVEQLTPADLLHCKLCQQEHAPQQLTRPSGMLRR